MRKKLLFISCIQNLIVSISPPEFAYLIVDRTNWKFGKKNINLLTIGALCQNIFMPLMWTQLNKQGNSNFKDIKKLITQLLKLLKRNNRNSKGLILLADREFIGADWFKYLATNKLSFVIRLREKMYFELHTFNGAYIQERHRYNRKIDELTKEL